MTRHRRVELLREFRSSASAELYLLELDIKFMKENKDSLVYSIDAVTGKPKFDGKEYGEFLDYLDREREQLKSLTELLWAVKDEK